MEGQIDGTPEITYAYRRQGTRIIKYQPEHQYREHTDEHARRSQPGKAMLFPQFEQGELPYHLIHKATRTQPAAERTSEENHRGWQQKPEAPEICRNPSPAGDDRTLLAIDKRHEKRTAKNPIKCPISQDSQHNKLDAPAQPEQFLPPAMLLIRICLTHPAPPASGPAPGPYPKLPI